MTEFKEPTVFEKVEQISGVPVPHDQRTPAMQAVFEALFAKAIDTDDKTGIANERVFNRHLERELARMQRHHTATRRGQTSTKPEITVVAIDLDGFRDINNTLGHLAGDAALRYFAHFMRDNLRPTDTIARVGGDEFRLIIEAPEQKTIELMENLRDALAEKGFSYAGKSGYLSFSFGVHQLRETDAERAKVIRQADDRQMDDKREKSAREVLYTRRAAEQGGDRQPVSGHVRRTTRDPSPPTRS